MLFNQTIKNINRVREIARILWKYGFEEVVAHTPLKSLVPERRRLSWKRREDVAQYTHWELIRMVVEELGPSFIKGAQMLSNRPDLLPDVLIQEFQKLQSDVPPFEFEVGKAIIEKELGKPLEEVFDYINEKPIGSASIGQVHVARLKDGTEVVVKIQRPKVKQQVETDLSIANEIAKRGKDFFESQGIINAPEIVKAFDKSMQKELNYLSEARNISQFRRYYQDYKTFTVPKVYKDFSTERILVLELIRGCKITDVQQLKSWGLNPQKIAETGMDVYLDQIFKHGFFHADPHPGNILIRKDGVICLIDFGMVGRLTRRDKHAFAGVLISMAQQNSKKMARDFLHLAINPDIDDMRLFEADLSEFIQDFATLDLAETSMAEIAARLQELIFAYRLEVPGGIFIILRALTILEGIGKEIHPNFNTYEFVKPYGIKILKDRYSPKNVTEDIFNMSLELFSFFRNFPVEIETILKKLRKGKLHVEIEHTGYEYAIERIVKSANRLSLTFLIVGLLISGAIMTSNKASIVILGMPYTSFIAFLLAFLFSGLLLLSVWRN